MSELNMPEIIYLQGDGSDENTTWCDERIDDDDTEYIRKDKYDTLRAENERLREALSKIEGSAGLPGLTGQDYINAIEFKMAECRVTAREALEVNG